MRHIVFAATTLFSTTSLAAQEQMPPMYVVVEKPTPALEECGLTHAGLESSVGAAMRYNRIERSDDIYAPFLYVQATGGSVGRTCAINVFVRFGEFQGVQFGERTVFGIGEVCSKNILSAGASVTSDSYNHIKQLIDQCTLEATRTASSQ